MARRAARTRRGTAIAAGTLFVLAALAGGCLDSSNNVTFSFDASGPDAAITMPPPSSTDGAVAVDAGPDAPPPVVEAGVDASATKAAFSGLGSGIVTHSAHFTLITKTGNEPGGAGVHGSKSFKVISGIGPSGTK